MPKPCRHLNTRVHGGNRIGYGSCPDCGKEINLSEVFDNWLNELRQVKAEVVGRKTLLGVAVDDPNLIGPGTDLTNVFPEEEP